MRLAQLHGLLPWLRHERPPELPVELLCETSPPFGVVSALLRLARCRGVQTCLGLGSSLALAHALVWSILSVWLPVTRSDEGFKWILS